MRKEISNLEELRAAARSFLHWLNSEAPKSTATVVGLSGDLGAGKTAFTKCVASILGITEIVTSPTFILEKVYIIPRESIVGEHFTKLIHIDAYRLHSAEEMKALDWEAILQDKQNLVLIEWPENVEDALPKNRSTLSFQYVSEEVRSITIN